MRRAAESDQSHPSLVTNSRRARVLATPCDHRGDTPCERPIHQSRCRGWEIDHTVEAFATGERWKPVQLERSGDRSWPFETVWACSSTHPRESKSCGCSTLGFAASDRGIAVGKCHGEESSMEGGGSLVSHPRPFGMCIWQGPGCWPFRGSMTLPMEDAAGLQPLSLCRCLRS